MENKTIKIAKFLSSAGITSRRKAEILIRQGLISVNNKTITDPARRINPSLDKITYQNKIIAPLTPVYYLLYKPIGYISTTHDPHHSQLAVTQLVPSIPKVWPVGRLDKNTSGLLILTNDGTLTQRLTHPKFNLEKEYEITTNRPLNSSDIARLRHGIKLEDGFIKPDKFETLSLAVTK